MRRESLRFSGLAPERRGEKRIFTWIPCFWLPAERVSPDSAPARLSELETERHWTPHAPGGPVFEEVVAGLKTWFGGIEAMGGSHLPMTMVVLETRAREVAAERGVQEFFGSPGFIQRWASRHRLKSVKLWGQAGSAAEAVRSGEQRLAESRAEVVGYAPENIYVMDETGLQYRWSQSRTYKSAGK